MNDDLKADLDQFYTKDSVAEYCLQLFNQSVPESNRKIVIEPSAGDGAFSDRIDNCIAIDIDPKKDYIQKKDFLKIFRFELSILDEHNENVSVFGNPPFGKKARLAIKFFNRATTFANHIAFIVPKTFRKKSVQKLLKDNFHLIHDFDLPRNGFVRNGKSHDVPCCFQIWKRSNEKRITDLIYQCDHFHFPQKADCDFAIRRAGSKSGKAFIDYANCSIESNYFVKMETCAYTKEQMIEIINSIDFSGEVNSTAGIRSLSKDELITKIDLTIGYDRRKSNAGLQIATTKEKGEGSMGKGLTYGQMKAAMERVDKAKGSFENIPQSFIDRLNKAVELST